MADTSTKFLLCFDQPADWKKRVRCLRISGWCVAANGEPLTAIRVLLRGQIFEGAFDRERPDVADYLGRPTTPLRCGFTVDLQVPSGKNDLQLQVADAEGRWHTVLERTVFGPLFATQRQQKREVELFTSPTHYDFWFDRPTDWTKPARTLYISGWCLEKNGGLIDGIRARIGSRKFSGNYGFERRDLGAIYGEDPVFIRSGFAIAVNLPPGKSLLTLEIRHFEGDWRPFSEQEVFGAETDDGFDEPLSPDEVAIFAPGYRGCLRLQFWLDHPTDWSRRLRRVRISGWCLTTRGEPVTAVRARIGRSLFHATYGIARPDIALAFEQTPGALRSGFSLDATLPRLPGTLVLEAGDAQGRWEPFLEQRVRGPFFRPRKDESAEAVGDYPAWIRLYDQLTEKDRLAIHTHLAQSPNGPLFSVLLPVYNPNPKWLKRAIQSVREQLYSHWELCVVDDASTDPRIWKLIESSANEDPRIKSFRRARNGHICAASNDALEMATGEFIALLDHDDELAPTALYFAALELIRDPQLRLLYTDEDKLDQRGRRCNPYFKPDWNPDFITSQNYISHLGIYQAELVRAVGGFRPGFEGSQDYDLTFRCIERIDASQICHIPRVLYHWRMAEQSTAGAVAAVAKPYALEAAARAVREHLARSGTTATVERQREIYLRVKHPAPADPPLVSMIIPTRDRVALLRQLIESVFEKTDYPNYELVVIDNGSSETTTLDYLEQLKRNPRVQLHGVPGPFNYSRLNNFGVSKAQGSVIALMNNDLEVINRDWLTEMVSHVLRPDVGAVGARLWYPDGTLQHGGVILGFGGVAGHIHGGTREDDGYFSRQHLTQDFSSVTAACMLVRKDLYLKMNGFDEANLAIAFNDVDFCLRLRGEGYRIVWTPYAEFFHYESASRGIEDTSAKQHRFFSEEKYMRDKWLPFFENDPSYNPNLSLETELFTLAFPPRTTTPWATDRIEP